jgi:predicted PurR-regulated permease PerM
VPRIISLIGLTVLVLALGYLFVQVMIGFLLPLFMAVLLAILFQPLHNAIARRLGGHARIAAGLTTALILFIVLAPIVFVIFRAGQDVALFILSKGGANPVSAEEPDLDSKQQPRSAAKERPSPASKEGPSSVSKEEPSPVSKETPSRGAKKELSPIEKGLGEIVTFINDQKLLPTIDTDEVRAAATEKARDWLSPLALKTPAFIGGFFINAFITVFALYYFLADGTDLIAATTELVPLDSKYQRQLLTKFVEMSRAVATATLVTAIIQGVLAAIGYYFAGLEGVVLLMILTTFAAFVPIVGSSIIWIPCSIWLLANGNTAAGIALAVWCLLMALAVDNVLKPMILHGQANLHPLLALLSVLGGVAAMGPIGIFVGPMAVAFLQTGLRMLNLELDSLRRSQLARKTVAS